MDALSYPFPNRFNAVSTNLRRTYRSYYSASVATNRATHSLYNGSTGTLVVAVKAVMFNGYAASPNTSFSAVQGIVGTNVGTVSPLWAGEANPAGQHCYADTTTVYTPLMFIGINTLQAYFGPNQMPWAVLPPGWSFLIQSTNNAGTVVLSWIWEELDIRDPALGSNFS